MSDYQILKKYLHFKWIIFLLLITIGPLSKYLHASKRPNILYIMTDQQPVNCVAVYGNPVIQTPNLDKLAASGITFHSAYIAAFPCSPSRACQFSGRYAHHHGVVKNDVIFDKRIPSLGGICKASGYDTAFFGKWHLGGNMYRNPNAKDPLEHRGAWYYKRIKNKSGFEFTKAPGGLSENFPQHGFETWVGGWKHYQEYLQKVGLNEQVKKHWNIGAHTIAPSGKEGNHIYSKIPQEHHMSAFLASQAEGYLREHASNKKPWCIVLSFYGPHQPVAPPQPWDTMYSLDQISLPDNHRDPLTNKPTSQQKNRVCYRLGKWTDDQFKDYLRRYWAYCSYIDQQVGRVLNALHETRQWHNTIILFTSDHGDMNASHGMIYKLGYCGYEELFLVPAILSIPGTSKPGSHTNAMVSNIDFLPTLLEAVGITLPKGIDGKSLIPLIKGETAHHRDMIFSDNVNQSLICRDRHYKFVLNWEDNELDELYNLEKDPGELKNLAYIPEYQQVKLKMMQHIFDWLDRTNHPYADQIKKKAAI